MKNYVQTFLNREAAGQFVKVGVIGVVNTVVSFTLFNILIAVFGATGQEGKEAELFWATAISFILATFMSYVLNRRWSFRLTEDGLSGRETVNFYIINLVALGVTTAFVSGADALWGPLSRLQANLAYGAAALIIIVPKFAGYRDIVFRKALDRRRDERVTETQR